MWGKRGWGHKRGVSVCARAEGVSGVGVVKKGAGGVKKGVSLGWGFCRKGGVQKGAGVSKMASLLGTGGGGEPLSV